MAENIKSTCYRYSHSGGYFRCQVSIINCTFRKLTDRHKEGDGEGVLQPAPSRVIPELLTFVGQ
jgi:hypothetical protein